MKHHTLIIIVFLLFLTGCGGDADKGDPGLNPPMRALPYTYEEWMGNIADDISIADISIPGTHDSGAFDSDVDPIENQWVIAQTHTIKNQLKLGVRWLDIRVRAQKKENGYYLGVYHGKYYLKLSFYSVLKSAKAFLEENPTETVIVMIKQEDSHLSSTDFSQEIYKRLKTIGLEHFYLEENTLPTMGEVRGKIIIFRRFGLGELGHKMGYWLKWKDQTTGSWNHNRNYQFYVQDYYHVDSGTYDKKIKHIEDTLYKAYKESFDDGKGKLYLNYTSCYATWHSNKTVAKHINPSINDYLKQMKHWGKVGVVLVNFAGDSDSDLAPSLVKNIIKANKGL